MDLCQVTIFILLGAILGSTGQCLRVIVGLKSAVIMLRKIAN